MMRIKRLRPPIRAGRRLLVLMLPVVLLLVLSVALASAADGELLSTTTSDNAFVVDAGLSTDGFAVVEGERDVRVSNGVTRYTWDGVDGESAELDATGLGGLDLTGFGLRDAFDVTVQGVRGSATLQLLVFTDDANASAATFVVERAGSYQVPFTDLTAIAGGGADLTDVGAIELLVDGVASVDALRVTSPIVTTDARRLVTDANGNGAVDAGDVVEHRVTLDNRSRIDTGELSLFAGWGAAYALTSVQAPNAAVMEADWHLRVGLEGLPAGEAYTFVYRLTATGAATSVDLVLQDGDTPPGSDGPVDALSGPVTNGVGEVVIGGDFDAGTDDTEFMWLGDGLIYTTDPLTPTSSIESSYGASDDGDFVASVIYTNGSLDSVITKDGVLLREEDPAPGFPGEFNTFNSRPMMTPDGTAYWVAGNTSFQGGSTEYRLLYKSPPPALMGATRLITPVLVAGDVISGFVLDTTMDFDYFFSDDNNHHIQVLDMEGDTTSDYWVYLDGDLLFREDSPIDQTENWDNFDIVQVNNDGNYVFSGDTNGSTLTDEFIAYNGSITLREGDEIDGVTLGSSVRYVSINNDNAVAYMWTDAASNEVLFMACAADALTGATRLIGTGDMVDVDGDTLPDATVTDFNTFSSSQGMSLAEDGMIYVEVDLDYGVGDLEAVIGLDTGCVPNTPQVIYTNLPDDDSSLVPGLGGVRFGPGTSTTHFDRPYGTANGSWALTADTDLPSGADEVLLVNDVVQAIEGDPAGWAPGESIGFLDTKVGANDAGDYVFATNTDGDTAADEYGLAGTPGFTPTVVAQEGISTNLPALPNTTWGSTIESLVIAEDGTVGLASDSVGGLPTTENEILVFGDTVLAQEGVTVPPGQIGSETWDNFDFGDFWISADGSQWMVQGDLTGDTATDDVVAVNGTVVIQEGTVISGSGFANPVGSSGILGIFMAPNGDWYARGDNDISNLDWVVRNGEVIAQRDEPIHVGTSERWSETDFSSTFFLQVGNGNGEYVIGGVTDADSATNGVLVYNGEFVAVREGDPIDLDGNGAFDDDLYFDSFGNDDAFLTDDNTLFFVATIKDGTDTRVGQGFFSLVISGPPPGGDVPAIALAKTAGTDAAACATTSTLVIEAGAAVTYCYTVENTGNVTLTLHDLVDSELGTLLDDFALDLAPGDSTFITESAVINVTTVNTATWTAFNPGPVNVAEATATATVIVADPAPLVCDGPTVGFDAGIPPDWTVVNNNPGNPVVWSGLAGCLEEGNFTGGSGDLACASSDEYSIGAYDTELWTPVIDLTEANAAQIDYLANYQNFAFVDFLDVDVSTDGGATWTTVLSWNEDHGTFGNAPGEAVTINLDAYAGQEIILRWHYYDPSASSSSDWYAQIDDVSLSCPTFPDIAVDPESVEATLPPDATDSVALTISNSGDAELNWSINEATGESTLPTLDAPPTTARAVVPVVESAADCALYDNYLGREPIGYAEHCAVTVPDVAPAPTPLDPTDLGYAQDIGFISDNFVNFQLNNFPGQSVIAQVTNVYYGMDFDATGTLWALNDDTDTLGTIDLATGAYAAVVSVPPPGADPNNIWTGLTIDTVTGTFYGSDGDGLYTIDPVTGATTQVGLYGGGVLMVDIAISSDGRMYGHDIVNDAIYSIDVATGAATLVGATGYDANFAQGMDFDAADGTLYIFLYIGGGANVYGTVNLLTGAVTPLAVDNPLGEFEGATLTSNVCEPADVPWLDVSPLSGTTGIGASDPVTLTFDTTGLTPGMYSANVCITSDDPDESKVVVPVSLLVEGEPTLYVSLDTAGSVGGVTYGPEDILAYDVAGNAWSLFFDGSANGVTANVDAVHLYLGDLLLSFDAAVSGLPGIAGTVDDSDVVLFDPGSGQYALAFDGSDIGLTLDGEDIDALTVVEDAYLAFSTEGTYYTNEPAGGGQDEDISLLLNAVFGPVSSATAYNFVDGSNLGLGQTDAQDTWAAHWDAALNRVFQSSAGDYNLGLPVTGRDVVVCTLTSFGIDNTVCVDPAIFWNGTAAGLTTGSVDGLFISFGGMSTADPLGIGGLE